MKRTLLLSLLSTLLLLVAALPAGASVPRNVAGTYYGIDNTAGTLVLKRTGRYTYNARSHGTYRVVSGGLVFAGPLRAWNHGHATLKSGVIQFYWTSHDGAKHWFVFQKG